MCKNVEDVTNIRSVRNGCILTATKLVILMNRVAANRFEGRGTKTEIKNWSDTGMPGKKIIPVLNQHTKISTTVLRYEKIIVGQCIQEMNAKGKIGGKDIGQSQETLD